LPHVELLGTSSILDDPHVTLIREVFPGRFARHDWERLWQLSTDGCSLTLMYDRLARAEPVVMAVRTRSGDVFGAYLSLGIRNSKRHYGTGETFVFTSQPHFQAFGWKGPASNSFFVSSTPTEISIGGGQTAAIWIGVDMLDGKSEPCATFGSCRLTSTVDFKIADLEVWRIGRSTHKVKRSFTSPL
jgi:hypothetical protein